MDELDFLQRLERLETTADHAERHTLALELSDTGDLRVFEVLVSLIERADLKGYKGTLVHCLGSYDCTSIQHVLRKLANEDDGELGWTARSILDEQGLN